jgi:hypothetical protein
MPNPTNNFSMKKSLVVLSCLAISGCSATDDHSATSSTSVTTATTSTTNSDESEQRRHEETAAAPKTEGDSLSFAQAAPDTEGDGESAFKVGQIAYSDDGGNTLVYSSEEVWMDETHEDMEAGIEGTHPLIKTVGPRTKLKLLEERIPIWRVKVLDGEHEGEEWWIRETCLNKTR